MKKPHIYISSSASAKDNIKDAVLELVNLGFLDIELSGGTKFYEGLQEDLFNLQRVHGINFYVHNYFPPLKSQLVMNITSKDRGRVNDTFTVINNAVKLTKRFGNSLYTIHPGYNKSHLYEKDGRFHNETGPAHEGARHNTRKDFYQALDLVLNLDIVRQNDIRIGVENLFPLLDEDIRSFLDSDADILEFLDQYKRDLRIGLLLDLGHLNVASAVLNFDKFKVIEEIFDRYPGKVFEVHMSENDGSRDGHGVLGLDSWQVDVIKRHRQALEDVPIVVEWWNAADDMAYQYFVKFKENLLKQ